MVERVLPLASALDAVRCQAEEAKEGAIWREGVARGSAEAAQDQAAVYGEPGCRKPSPRC